MTREHWLIPETSYESYQDYLGRAGAAAGVSAVAIARSRTPDAILDEIQQSGLRGRGGAGFPTGTKWRTIRKHPCERRFVVCNAAEGEPGTFKDRYLLRKNPYATLEGMLIAAHTIGARDLYIAMKTSFTRETERVRGAIGEMDRAGLLEGLAIEVVEGPEEYLFGEEKALLEVIEGNGPMPREAYYPPYEKGLFTTPFSPNPALVNNAQTFALVPGIVRSGAASFRALGTHDTPGTLIFTVLGDVARPGVYEREAGITLRELFEEVAGGARPGRTLKCALSGVSSGVIPATRFDTPADFASLQMIGAGLGSAGFIVLENTASVPRMAQAVARFLYVESCNQCSACKFGLRNASQALDAIFDPREASREQIERALFGARGAPQANRCYLPVQGAILIPSLIETYDEEFESQIAGTVQTDPVPIPKIVDFDETTRRFAFDEKQARKTPRWTYEEPEPPPPGRAHAPAESPHDASRAPVGVRLAPDLFENLAARAESRGVPIDALVNEAVRRWIESGPR